MTEQEQRAILAVTVLFAYLVMWGWVAVYGAHRSTLVTGAALWAGYRLWVAAR